VRSYLILLLLLPWLVLTSVLPCRADVIHLKNGRTIWADHVRQSGSHVEYDIGDNTYAVPQSSVDHVESGGVPPQFASSAATKSDQDMPTVVPQEELMAGADLPSKLIRDGHVDTDALRSVEDSSQPEITAAAYFIAGKHEFDGGNFPQARAYFDSALRFQPDSPTILDYYAATLVKMGRAKEAVSYAERATRIAPASADAFAILGAAQYASDDTKDAARSWKTSLRLRPDASIQAYLDKAEREMKDEANFSERMSAHFTLHFEGKQTSDSFRQAILMTLESSYGDLERDLSYTPRENIPVFLFTEQAYFDVTQAPAWTGAVNDGKLRIPIRGMDSVNSELARVLKHELTHSFINQMSAGRCPQWLHEGIAQALEPKELGSRGRRLQQLFAVQQEIPFNALEAGFMQFSTVEAMLAYDESLAAVQFITDAYGVSELPRILARIGEGTPTEVALRTTIHEDYGQLQTDLAKFLANKYGN
jgi:tetratricopeptide (TPR) repeat protein